MNKQIFEGKWNQFKGKLREEWAELTDDDLEALASKRDQLIGHIQEKTGQARDEIKRKLDALASKI